MRLRQAPDSGLIYRPDPRSRHYYIPKHRAGYTKLLHTWTAIQHAFYAPVPMSRTQDLAVYYVQRLQMTNGSIRSTLSYLCSTFSGSFDILLNLALASRNVSSQLVRFSGFEKIIDMCSTLFLQHITGGWLIGKLWLVLLSRHKYLTRQFLRVSSVTFRFIRTKKSWVRPTWRCQESWSIM